MACCSFPLAYAVASLAVIYNQALSIVNTSNIVGAVLHLARIEASGNTKSRPRRSPFRSVDQSSGTASKFLFVAVVVALVSGCGANYRPVVSAINPVGPAGQPLKYAVAISDPSPVTAAGAPDGASLPGLVTLVDFSGDEVVITANVGVDPYYLVLNSGGTTGYTLNGDGTLSNFAVVNTLLTSQVLQTTLLRNPGNPGTPGVPEVLPASIFPQGTFTYVTQPAGTPSTPGGSPPGRNSIAEFTGAPLSLQQELPVSSNPNSFSPIYVAGAANAPRSFAISQNIDPTKPGIVSTIENTTNPTIDLNTIPVGVGPVYGVMTADFRRAFIMNKTDGTVSVINAQTNALDIIPAGATNPIQVGSNPLWADFAPTRNELVVANEGDGVNPGSISLINIPLCSATAQIDNPTCDPNNPVDAVGFGTVLATVPVGVNPVMVGVLQDGTRAYVVNEGNLSLPCGPGTSTQAPNCSVSVVNLTTNTVTAIIPLVTASITKDTLVNNGHPNYIAVTTGSPTGKVYVTSPESTSMTIIRTDTDQIDTTVPLQGRGISVRVTAP
jgi:hypothetical protein